MSLCQKCDPAGFVHGLEIQFLEKTRKKLIEDVRRQLHQISKMLSGEDPMNRFVGDSLKESLDGIEAIDHILIVLR